MKLSPFASALSDTPIKTAFKKAFCVGALLALALGTSAARADAPRLVNLSARGPVGTGANILIGGFVIGQGTPETLLIRAVGPELTTYGVRYVLLKPILSIYDSTGTQIQANEGWSTGNATATIMASAGAFPLPAGSGDSALVVTLPAGAYTAQVAGAGATTGNALLEIYEVGATASTARLVNLSVRGEVRVVTQQGAATDIEGVIAGFVVGGGTGSRSLLVRVAGPSLAQFSLTGLLANPSLSLFDPAGAIIAQNGDWGTPFGQGADAATLSAAFAQSGAFPFASGSLDSALIEAVPAGAADTAQPVGDTTSSNNLALVEVYDITPQ